MRDAVEHGLPDEFRGWPTRFGWDAVPVTHHVEVAELGAWLDAADRLRSAGGISTRQWLCAPQQRLLEVTSGAVFHDDGGELAAVRAALAWYPDDVWLWLLACQWRRLDQEEPFVGRAAEVGDELGSRVVAARLVRDVMRWRFCSSAATRRTASGSARAFAQLDAAVGASARVARRPRCRDYEAREDALVAAVEELASAAQRRWA